MKELLTEKYRPQSLDEIALPARLKNNFKDGIVQNMLFYGTQGAGKTSLAKLLCKQFGNSCLYINCSSETGIDTVRERICNYCETASLVADKGKLKIVLLDEFDNMSAGSYAALRGVIEKYASNTRFVATCNFINKVPDPIQSRFVKISFDFEGDELVEVKKQMVFRLRHICKEEGLNMDDKAIAYLIKHDYPDYRKIINKMQQLMMLDKNGEPITVEDVTTTTHKFTEVYDIVLSGSPEPAENYKAIANVYRNKVDDVVASLGLPFIQYIMDTRPDLVRFIPHVTIINAKYQAQLGDVIDPMVSLLALVFELQELFSGKMK
jgi:replication-associated recombination protein RarA